MHNLNNTTLAYKTKNQLIDLLAEQVEAIQEAQYSKDEDTEYIALENIEQVIYVLRNCEYEGKV